MRNDRPLFTRLDLIRWDGMSGVFARSISMLRAGNSRLAFHGLISISSQIVWGAQSFITFLIGARLLPRKELGFVVAANAILFGGQCLLLGPITNPTLRLGGISSKSLRVTYWMYCAVTGIVCSTFLILGAQMGRLFYKDPAFFDLIGYLSIPFATTSFYAVQKLILFARMRYTTALTMDVLFGASNIAILLVLHSNAMLSSAIWFYMARSGAALIGLAPVVCVYAWSKRAAGPRAEAPFAYRDYFQHSKYSSAAMLGGYGQSQVDALAVAHFLSPLSAATYGAAKVFYTGIAMVTTGLMMVVLPASSRIAAGGKGGMGRFYRRALLLSYALLLPSVAALAVLTGPVLRLCFGGRYPDAAPIVRIFCIAALVMPVSSITDAVANGAGWWRRACLAAITGGAIGVAGSLCLTPALGLLGAAMAPVLALAGASCVIACLTWSRLGAGGSAPDAGTRYADGLAGENEC